MRARSQCRATTTVLAGRSLSAVFHFQLALAVRSLEGLLLLVEEGVAVRLELERQLRPAAAHLEGQIVVLRLDTKKRRVGAAGGRKP